MTSSNFPFLHQRHGPLLDPELFDVRLAGDF